ncbi:hypothetical protein ACHAAC_07180 [Aeromicrobium sp. CF4.19]|uniref:hypothetical protein n=1 Tax=Aeromicrobium sp. CF4.19 TaxID=3373082 RepID=UPI003EE4379E
MHSDMEALAEANGGYLHRGDILDLGGTDAMIRSALVSGELTRLRVGTFAYTDVVSTLTPEKRHVVLARSVVDKFESGSVALSHHSAAAVHGLGLYDVDLSIVHLVRLDPGAGRHESGVHHHRWTPSVDAVQVDDGRLAVRPDLATWQVACATSQRGALVVMDSGLHSGLVLPEQLEDTAGRFHGWTGSRGARVMVRLADAGAETPGESLTRFTCWECHLPRPTTQIEIIRADGTWAARGDLGWWEYRHVDEFDGFRKYLRDLRPGEHPSDVVVREKRREDEIRAQLFGVSRTVWADVQPDRSRATGMRLMHCIEESNRLYNRGRRHLA